MHSGTIGFIGGGNMAVSLIGGLIADGTPASQIWASAPSEATRLRLKECFGITVTANNSELAAHCNVVLLAVKPQKMHEVCTEIAAAVRSAKPLVVSIAAGVRTADIERWLGGDIALIRTMPNTPALVQCGATALYATPRVSNTQRESAETIMRAVGLTLWLESEHLMDAVTALSGSGPAYFFLVLEALEEAGVKLGLPAEIARLLALQTAFGAAKMALESPEDCATLRKRVTSPGGTTERAIGILEQGELRGLFAAALAGARDRARELADQFGKL
ncbi:MAG TPA: pyrroline-5-carboxylate reductase [Gammaproteobacteria bacterium]